MSRRCRALACAALFVAAACSDGGASNATATATPPPAGLTETSLESTTPPPTPPPVGLAPDAASVTAAATQAAAMSDEQAVGQLLMPVAHGSDANQVSASQAQANQSMAGVDTPAQMVAKYHLGGVILMGRPGTEGGENADNVSSPGQIATLTAGLQTAAAGAGAGVPILIATDQEGGVVTRVPEPATQFPGNMALGATGNPALASQAAAATGKELRAMGVNVDFAPVADVTSGQGNTVIGSRSFGSDPAQVAPFVAAAVSGYQSAGVAATAKHFPGHGGTDVDSHVGTPHLPQSLAQLSDVDMAPFAAAVVAGSALVMTGHLVVDAVDPNNPATLSAPVITDLLRAELGFTGVVVTDALRMPPITDRYDSGQAAVQAVLAGNDLLELPVDLAGAYAGLLAAVKDGTLPRSRVNESVARLLALRGQLATQPTPDPPAIGAPGHQALTTQIARAAVTLAAGPCTGPLVPPGPVSVTGADAETRTAMDAALQAAGFTTDATPDAETTTVALTDYGDGAVTGDIAVALDTPYPLGQSDAPVKIAAYSSTSASLQAVAQVLAGEIPATGRLPVLVDGLPPAACP